MITLLYILLFHHLLYLLLRKVQGFDFGRFVITYLEKPEIISPLRLDFIRDREYYALHTGFLIYTIVWYWER